MNPEEFNEYYFDGDLHTYKHSGGYRIYERIYMSYGGKDVSFGEHFKDVAKKIYEKYNLHGLKVLDVGCAKGFIVEDLRGFGVDAYGIDVSEYAISCAEESIKPYLYIGNAITDLNQFSDNEFDYIISKEFLDCVDRNDLSQLINEMNRISKKQIHIVLGEVLGEVLQKFYINEPVSFWKNLNFSDDTIFILKNRIFPEIKES